jgi:hypothetical protein
MGEREAAQRLLKRSDPRQARCVCIIVAFYGLRASVHARYSARPVPR